MCLLNFRALHWKCLHHPQRPLGRPAGGPQDRSAGPQHTIEKRKRNVIPHSKQVPNDPKTTKMIWPIFIETTVGQKGVVSPIENAEKWSFFAFFTWQGLPPQEPEEIERGPKKHSFPRFSRCLGGQKVGT